MQVKKAAPPVSLGSEDPRDVTTVLYAGAIAKAHVDLDSVAV